MTNQLKDNLLSHVINLTDESGSVVLEPSKLSEIFDISATEVEYLLEDFEEKSLIQGVQELNMDSGILFKFDVTHKATLFLTNGGYSEVELALKKKNQIESDVNQAAIRSADASEISALAAVKSAKEAMLSRYIAILAFIISIIALVLEYRHK